VERKGAISWTSVDARQEDFVTSWLVSASTLRSSDFPTSKRRAQCAIKVFAICGKSENG